MSKEQRKNERDTEHLERLYESIGGAAAKLHISHMYSHAYAPSQICVCACISTTNFVQQQQQRKEWMTTIAAMTAVK